MNPEDEERVIVYLPAHHVDHRGQMLAGYGPVGTGALHLEVGPLLWEHFQSRRFGNIEHGRIQLPVQQFRYQAGLVTILSMSCSTCSLKKGGTIRLTL